MPTYRNQDGADVTAAQLSDEDLLSLPATDRDRALAELAAKGHRLVAVIVDVSAHCPNELCMDGRVRISEDVVIDCPDCDGAGTIDARPVCTDPGCIERGHRYQATGYECVRHHAHGKKPLPLDVEPPGYRGPNPGRGPTVELEIIDEVSPVADAVFAKIAGMMPQQDTDPFPWDVPIPAEAFRRWEKAADERSLTLETASPWIDRLAEVIGGPLPLPEGTDAEKLRELKARFLAEPPTRSTVDGATVADVTDYAVIETEDDKASILRKAGWVQHKSGKWSEYDHSPGMTTNEALTLVRTPPAPTFDSITLGGVTIPPAAVDTVIKATASAIAAIDPPGLVSDLNTKLAALGVNARAELTPGAITIAIPGDTSLADVEAIAELLGQAVSSWPGERPRVTGRVETDEARFVTPADLAEVVAVPEGAADAYHPRAKIDAEWERWLAAQMPGPLPIPGVSDVEKIRELKERLADGRTSAVELRDPPRPSDADPDDETTGKVLDLFEALCEAKRR